MPDPLPLRLSKVTVVFVPANGVNPAYSWTEKKKKSGIHNRMDPESRNAGYMQTLSTCTTVGNGVNNHNLTCVLSIYPNYLRSPQWYLGKTHVQTQAENQ